MGRLDNKIAIVTGGNSGIGEATAKLFAKEGATVVITARRENELRRVRDEILAAGGQCMYVPGDVRVTADVENVVAKTIEAYGRIDILVNNAGIPDSHKRAAWVTDEFWDDVHDTDLKGVLRFCRAVLPHMEERNYGSIVNVCSIGGIYFCAGAAYSSAKAGVRGLTGNLAIQYFATGIRVNCVSPGSTLTPLFDPERMGDIDTEMLEITAQRHYQDRTVGMLDPMQQAYTILFLASDEASGINGQNITVDAGGRL